MNDLVCKKTYAVMGGEFQFATLPQNFLTREAVLEIFDEAYLEVKRIEEKFTDFRPSDFNKINDASGLHPVEVDEEILHLVKKAISISALSEGTFDISFASIGHMWRVKKAHKESLDQDFINSHIKFVNYRLIEVDEVKKTIYLPFKEMKIGLGGIGKGYAVDAVYELFLKRGLYNFTINGAGDVRVHSRADAPRKWRLGIRNPLSTDASKAVGVVQLAMGSVASSGGYIHNVNGDKFNNHIINPRTGLSNREIIASTVVAIDAITADTTATMLMNMNPKSAIEYLDRHHLAGLVFSPEGVSYVSQVGLENFGLL